MWYCYRLAQLTELMETLKPEHRQFIEGLKGTPYLGHVVNRIKKDSNVSIPELNMHLFSLKQTNQANKPTNTQQEIDISKNFTDPAFENWVLVQLRKIRRTANLTTNTETYEYNIPLNELYQIISQIWDWYRLNSIRDINSYDITRAKAASDVWHQTMIGSGEGLIYEPTNKENVVYQFQGDDEHPDWNGWTIHKVRSPNDLKAEGNLMNHCVGGYARDVEQGRSQIFSLRDPYNKPHATIEITDNGNSVEQIQGNSNKEPKQEYKEMLRNWFESLPQKLISKKVNEDEYNDWGYNPEDFDYDLDAQSLGGRIESIFWQQDHPEEAPSTYDADYGLELPQEDYDTLYMNEAYEHCNSLLTGYLSEMSEGNKQYKYQKIDTDDYISGLKELSESLVKSAFDHDQLTLEKAIKENTEINYEEWAKRYHVGSFLHDLREKAVEKIDEEIELEGTEDEEFDIKSMTHKMAQNEAIRTVGVDKEAIKQYWQNKFKVYPQNFSDQYSYLSFLQEKYESYTKTLEDDASLFLKLNKLDPDMPKWDADVDFALAVITGVKEELPKLRELILKATTVDIGEKEKEVDNTGSQLSLMANKSDSIGMQKTAMTYYYFKIENN